MQFKFPIFAAATALVIAGAALSFAPVNTAHATLARVTEPPWASPEFRAQFMRSCGDCHSNETKWPWYSQLPIVAGFIRDHVNEGREHLNVSEWGTTMQGEHAEHVAEVVQKGEMPPASYLLLHPDARLDAAAVQTFVTGANGTFGIQASGEESEEHDK
jgi:mono/diheme cytochrome c family protein